jgi:hypothetical protein
MEVTNMTSITATERANGHDIIADAERLRRQANALVDEFPNRYADLAGQPSGWCVVTEKGWWSREFHTIEDEDHLCEIIEWGHRVILMLGLVAYPYSPLTATNHAEVVSIAEPCRHSSKTLARIIARAKRHAVSAMSLRSCPHH